MIEQRKKLSTRLAAYSLAAGVAAVSGQVVNAGSLVYNNGGAGWFAARPHFGGQTGGYDMILFKLDGTVLVGDAAIDPTLPNDSSIEFMGENYNAQYNWGDGKSRDSAFLRLSNAGVVGSYWSAAAEASKLAHGVTIGPASSFVTGDAEGDVGLYGYGWYSVVGQFGGRGYLGFYIDNAATGRHYGWAEVTIISSRNEITLHQYAVETQANVAIDPGSLMGPFQLMGSGDDDVNANDVDVLRANLGDPEYDINFDGVGDADDIAHLVRQFGDLTGGGVGTEVGDVNFDGLINATDLILMATAFGQTGQGYAAGNLNADDVVDGTDLAILKANFGYAASAVPEPITLSLLGLGAAGLTIKRQRE